VFVRKAQLSIKKSVTGGGAHRKKKGQTIREELRIQRYGKGIGRKTLQNGGENIANKILCEKLGRKTLSGAQKKVKKGNKKRGTCFFKSNIRPH